MVFFASISNSIHYVTIKSIENKKAHTLVKSIENIIRKYASRGFTVTDVFGDEEFDVEDIITQILPETLHTCSADEHIHRIERTIQTIKERACTICHTLPYDAFPKLVTTSLMKNVAMWIN